MTITGIITEIERYSIHDGPGIRTVVFFKGCQLQCQWCCNPETIDPYIEMGWSRDQCITCLRCVKDCPYGAITVAVDGYPKTDWSVCMDKCYKTTEVFFCSGHCCSGARRAIGKRVSIPEVVREVEKDNRIYARSGGGVTLSGGEASFQPEFSLAILQAMKAAWINAAIETNGSGQTEIFERFAPFLNFVFLDLKVINEEKHKAWTNTSNKLILINAVRLAELSQKFNFTIVIRTPIIPGLNDSLQEIEQIGLFIKRELPGVNQWELLPYHKLGHDKYTMIGLKYELEDLSHPSLAKMENLEKVGKRLSITMVNY
jgi:pyruvate formate lyase activating enzyme